MGRVGTGYKGIKREKNVTTVIVYIYIYKINIILKNKMRKSHKEENLLSKNYLVTEWT